jgi:hypothetical protein
VLRSGEWSFDCADQMSLFLKRFVEPARRSPRSGRRHKAWGASSRIVIKDMSRVREVGGSAVTRFAGSVHLFGKYLGLAPQALCLRPLRGL